MSAAYDIDACRAAFRALRDRVVPRFMDRARYSVLEQRLSERCFGVHATAVTHLQVAWEIDAALPAWGLDSLEKSAMGDPPAWLLYDAGVDLRAAGPEAAGRACPVLHGQLLGRLPMPWSRTSMTDPTFALVFKLLRECPARPVEGTFDGEIAPVGARVGLPHTSGLRRAMGAGLAAMLDDAPHVYEVWIDVKLAPSRSGEGSYLTMPDVRAGVRRARGLSELLTVEALP